MNAADYAQILQDRVVAQSTAKTKSPAIQRPVIDPEFIEIVPVDEPIDTTNIRAITLIELILKDRPRLHRLLRVPQLHAALLPRFLAISLTGFVLFGLAMSLVLSVATCWPNLHAIEFWINHPNIGLISFEQLGSSHGGLSPWLNGDALKLIGAYAFGLVAAIGVCLPSLYFYCLLAGVRMSMVEVVVHSVKAHAVAAVALVGILPIYVAVAMGAFIFGFGESLLSLTLFIGLALPFIAGFWGTISLCQGFSQLCDTMPADRAEKRACFLRRLVFSWSACYSAVVPVMVYSLWEVLSRA